MPCPVCDAFQTEEHRRDPAACERYIVRRLAQAEADVALWRARLSEARALQKSSNISPQTT